MNRKQAFWLGVEVAGMVTVTAFILWSQQIIYDNRVTIARFGATPVFGFPLAQWFLLAVVGVILFRFGVVLMRGEKDDR